jgi:hypothetical protein
MEIKKDISEKLIPIHLGNIYDKNLYVEL